MRLDSIATDMTNAINHAAGLEKSLLTFGKINTSKNVSRIAKIKSNVSHLYKDLIWHIFIFSTPLHFFIKSF